MTRYNDQVQLWPQSPTGGTDISPTSQLRTLRQTEVRARDATKVHVMSEPESCGECEEGACSLGKVFILCKLEDLSALPQTHVEKQLGVVVCTCNLSTELAGIDKSPWGLVENLPSLLGRFQPRESAGFKNKRRQTILKEGHH